MTPSTEVEPPVVTAPLSAEAAEEAASEEAGVPAWPAEEEAGVPPHATSESARAPASKEAVIRFMSILSFCLVPFLSGRV